MNGDVLRTALELQRSPLQRFALQQQALPPDIGRALQLAAGSPDALQEAAESLGVEPDTLLEAVRFYLEQVLFIPEADAYRVLGLGPDAPQARVREHFHWLQRWLHPDRLGDDWAALYATRVNQAWSRLRNESARRAYDAECSTAPTPSTGLAPLAVATWKATPVATHEPHWLRRLALAAALGLCALLFVMALTRTDAPPQWQAVSPPARAKVPATKDAEARRPGTKAGRTVEEATRQAPSVAALAGPAIPPDVAKSTATAAGNPGRGDGLLAPRPAHEHAAPKPAAVGPQPVAQAPAAAPAMPASAGRAGAGEAAGLVAARAAPAPVPVRPDRAERLVATRTQPQVPRSMPAPAELVVAGVAPDHAGLALTKAEASLRANDLASAPARASVVLASPLQEEPESPTSAAGEAAMEAPPGETGAGRSGADAVADAGRLPPLSGAEAVARVNLARRQVSELVTWFQRADAPPPAWSDGVVVAVLDRERSALRERAGAGALASFALDSPRWEVSERSAVLDTGYSVNGEPAAGESGRLSVDMTWRGEAWQITRFELRPQP